jgi:hypothetical protein
MNPGSYEYGLWSLMIINTAVFVLFALGFFKPKTRVDWKVFGATPGFIPTLRFASQRTGGPTRTGNAPSGSAM